MFKKLLLALCMACFIVTSNAETKSTSTNPPIVLTPKKGSGGNGQRAPGISFVTAYYNAGTLTFDGISRYGAVSAEVTYQESGLVWSAFLDEESCSMEIGYMPGSYTIVVTIEDNGTCLYGAFEMDSE